MGTRRRTPSALHALFGPGAGTADSATDDRAFEDPPGRRVEARGRRTYTDIRYEVATPPAEGAQIAKLTICRPEVRNAFRPQTLIELADAFDGPVTTCRSG